MITIKIVNDGTGDIETGNYRYQVLVNQDVIDSGLLENHKRRDGWRQLVAKLLIHSLEEDNRRLAVKYAQHIGKG